MAATRREVIAECLMVALAYYAATFLGLQVAIPPGYATLFWPGAGIALAATYIYGPRILPGVWLGSFLANLMCPSGSNVGLASIPATGAVVQAWLGAFVMHAFLPKGWIRRPASVLAFFAIVLATTVNALWSPTLLGLQPFLRQVGTWWLGDVIGACVFTPMLLFFNERKDPQ